ncbi:MAG: hypothetical protein J6V11_02890 [Alphaproteobacteria bacterium]|nr:hypothetical protein [Alphaproteobacteria bacterium]
MMKKWVLGAGCLMVLTACHSVQNYDDYLDSWVGRSEADLVATWGAPAQMQNLGAGRQLFTYMKQKTVMEPEMNPQDVNFGNYSLYNPENDIMQSETVYYCETTFTTENDIIVDYSWSGDACVR